MHDLILGANSLFLNAAKSAGKTYLFAFGDCTQDSADTCFAAAVFFFLPCGLALLHEARTSFGVQNSKSSAQASVLPTMAHVWQVCAVLVLIGISAGYVCSLTSSHAKMQAPCLP